MNNSTVFWWQLIRITVLSLLLLALALVEHRVVMNYWFTLLLDGLFIILIMFIIVDVSKILLPKIKRRRN